MGHPVAPLAPKNVRTAADRDIFRAPVARRAGNLFARCAMARERTTKDTTASNVKVRKKFHVASAEALQCSIVLDVVDHQTS